MNSHLQPTEANMIFQHVGKFISLTTDEQFFFESLLSRRDYSKRQVILGIGDACRFQNFVLLGSLKVYYLDEQGEEHIAKFAMENWWAFDIQSFFESSPSYYGIRCLEDTTVLQLSQQAYETLLARIPSFEKFYRLMLQQSFIALQHRITQSQSLTAVEKYVQFQEKYPGLESRISQKNIAAYLGITPVFLSMIRKHEIKKH
ncbi:MAG: Crp/Fnr family transcriptional regulator [Chryseolinea sp.]